MSIEVRLEECPFDPGAELGALLGEAAGDGAVVSFVGTVRSRSKEGHPLDALILEEHPVLTRQSLEEIATAAARRFDVSHVRVVHRCGELHPGEPIVFAGAASPHRRAAFEAADYLMDRLKTEAVLWKREQSGAGSHWIEPTGADYRERERWG
ncbi:MAG TPA: molybdenum cofactor biosynthesis protein MoaE [Sphingomicrobium sp.]|jgi:molybdopterin synthase catalytic subunit|nr:molybdenum cofactor biosynthesis protein MoaE [Sphingomicrobium sp.]